MDKALTELTTIFGIAVASAVMWHALLRRWILASTAAALSATLLAYGVFNRSTISTEQAIYLATVLVNAWIVALGVGIPFNHWRKKSLAQNIGRPLSWIEIAVGLAPAAVLTYLLFKGRA